MPSFSHQINKIPTSGRCVFGFFSQRFVFSAGANWRSNSVKLPCHESRVNALKFPEKMWSDLERRCTSKSWMQIDQAVEWMIHEARCPMTFESQKSHIRTSVKILQNIFLTISFLHVSPSFFPCNNMSLQHLLSRYLPFGG